MYNELLKITIHLRTLNAGFRNGQSPERVIKELRGLVDRLSEFIKKYETSN